ncbi:hypothetical protein K490DRAFT_61006 [Saccharata proteae CBS 121410]|uniref:SnoaL-like domain-containing protein n=1 Tax=Saccharata proteae CBS 121410 TaxID=1314787 RepID=A0A9P4LZX1_9PEZI|nr:hypothetical protein K490DRAFT_61006 [Saccharata proteae CBS 121410]
MGTFTQLFQFSLLLIPQALFASSNTTPQFPCAVEAIRQTLNTYPLAIDSKDFAALSAVFTTDAVANYSAPLNVLTGLRAIQSTLNASLLPVTTQHALATSVIRVEHEPSYQNASETVPTTARSITYYTATHFGHGLYEGQTVTAWGRYEDALVLKKEGWRIRRRHLVYMGPITGNLSIFNNTLATVAEPSLPGWWD